MFIQVLSVVAQQLLTIQNALKANMSPFNFEGRMIKLVPTCGVFITMVRDQRDWEGKSILVPFSLLLLKEMDCIH